MRLRDFIQNGGNPRLATATPATVATHGRLQGPTVARVATVAVAGGPVSASRGTRLDAVEPEEWPRLMRACPLATILPVRWPRALAALAMLDRAGVVAEALRCGWDARDLVGVSSTPPHDCASGAGLVFSLKAGDLVRGVSPARCIIAAGPVRHLWQRRALPDDGSVCLPWELPA
jgi:hypothetical protein